MIESKSKKVEPLIKAEINMESQQLANHTGFGVKFRINIKYIAIYKNILKPSLALLSAVNRQLK